MEELEATLRRFESVAARWRLREADLVAITGVGRLELMRRDLLAVPAERAIRHVIDVDGFAAALLGGYDWVADWLRLPNPGLDPVTEPTPIDAMRRLPGGLACIRALLAQEARNAGCAA